MPRRSERNTSTNGSSEVLTSPKRRRTEPAGDHASVRITALGRDMENISGRVRSFDAGTFWRSNPALAVNEPMEVDDTPLKVSKVDLDLEANRVAHHTDEYEVENLIIRRGQEFNVALTFDRSMDKANDQVILQFVTGDKPMASKGTLIRVPVDTSIERDPDEWQAAFVGGVTNATEVKVTILPASDAIVGKYKLYIVTNPKEAEEYKHLVDEEIYVLFNAWCKDDLVYMEDPAMREEYVMNYTGRIWTSGPNYPGRPWYFGQFEDDVFKGALCLLDKADMLDISRSSAVHVSRAISAMANSNDDDDGVLTGRWTKEYPKDSTVPWAWTGSVKIMEEYMKDKKAVRYGQCWVFSGIVTSLLRSLGIPTRSITNFESAHDSDNSMTIDFHFDHEDKSVDDLNDSIWNFHVWNESWFKRPDLPEGYDGWQAHDATPQESSEGMMRCGPASCKAIKNGEVYLPYDANFIFGEVNGDKCFWQLDKKGLAKFLYKDPFSVGRAMMTKAVGSDAGENVTGHYKYPEGSAEERKATAFACRFGSKKDKKIYKLNVEQEIELKLKQNAPPVLGQDFTLHINLKNISKNARTVVLKTTAVASFYTGVPGDVIADHVFEETINGDQDKDLTFLVKETDYRPIIKPEAAIQVYAKLSVKDTEQRVVKVQKYAFRKPDLELEIPEMAKLAEKFTLKLKFKNPLMVELTNCSFRIDARGMAKGLVQSSDNVKPGAEVCHAMELKTLGRRGGRRYMVATFNSDQLSDVTGMGSIMVE